MHNPAYIPSIVGLDISEARMALDEYGYTMRITNKDGAEQVGDCRANPKRVNVGVEDDKVVKVYGIG